MRLPILILLALVGTATGCFGDLLFLDSLPNSNLNLAAGDLQSNAALGESDPTAAFDATSITFSQYTDISSVSIWSVASVFGQPLGDEFSSVSLYFRAADGTWQVLETGSPDTSFDVPGDPNAVGSSNPNMIFTQVSYSGPVSNPANSYEGAPGVYYPIWQNTFLNLDMVLPPGTYEFGINGVGADPDASTGYGFWYTSFVDGPLSGSYQSSSSYPSNPGIAQSTSNGSYLRCSYADLSGPCFQEDPVADGTWDTPLDMNIEIDGTTLPEPGSAAMLGIGLFALGVSGLVARFRRSEKSVHQPDYR